MAKKSVGRVKDSVRNNSLNSGTRSMDAQTFATQRNLDVDFPGTKENMAISISTGIGSEDSLRRLCSMCGGG